MTGFGEGLQRARDDGRLGPLRGTGLSRAEFIEKLRHDIERMGHAVGEGFKFKQLGEYGDRLAARLDGEVADSVRHLQVRPISPVIDRRRWEAALQAVTGAWRWKISGGRGQISRVVVQEPPDSGRINIEIRVDL